MKNLNFDFITKAEVITKFNIPTSEFTKLDNKKEIQHLFHKHYFPDSDFITVKTVDIRKLNKSINYLKTSSITRYRDMHNYPGAYGPGEIALYALVDTAVIGGISSAGCDLIDEKEGYEIKAASISIDNQAYGFELGREVVMDDLKAGILELNDDMGIVRTNQNIKISSIQILKSDRKKRFTEIEQEYKKRAYNYFSRHKTIFLRHNDSKAQGEVAKIKNVKVNDISIHYLSRNTIYPKVKL